MPATASAFFNVRDIDRSLKFYEALGFRATRVYRDDDGTTMYADLDLDGADFGLGAISSNDDPGFVAWVSTPLGAGVVIYFTVADVDSVFAKAKRAGAVIEVPLQDRSYGRVFTLNDPDGYVVTFIAEPPAPRKKAAAKRPAKAAKKAGAKAKKAKAPAKKGAAKKAGKKARR